MTKFIDTYTRWSFQQTCMVRCSLSIIENIVPDDCNLSATVFKDDPMNPARGKRYRDKILLVGGSKDEIDILTVGILPLNQVATN